ncbi:hypothetical protein LR48_Vigan07g147200 [Vigna angularis]|uniref:Uncharacterized protein n=1 Tax=Phaseolus angularis TaxID=3914 RepID=A0A0L9UYB0_PHAAN|nr:hypothetical protein LR48_Vigan07g147200 [Vigna angularis]
MKRTHGLVWLHADSSVQLGQQRTSTRGPTQDHASMKWKREPADEGIHASSSLGDSARPHTSSTSVQQCPAQPTSSFTHPARASIQQTSRSNTHVQQSGRQRTSSTLQRTSSRVEDNARPAAVFTMIFGGAHTEATLGKQHLGVWAPRLVQRNLATSVEEATAVWRSHPRGSLLVCIPAATRKEEASKEVLTVQQARAKVASCSTVARRMKCRVGGSRVESLRKGKKLDTVQQRARGRELYTDSVGWNGDGRIRLNNSAR